MKLARNCSELKGLPVNMITFEGFELKGFVAEISPTKGFTIKVLDLDEAEKLEFNMKRGTRNEGNIVCVNLVKYPQWKFIFDIEVEHLFEILDGNETVYDFSELTHLEYGDVSPIKALVNCAF